PLQMRRLQNSLRTRKSMVENAWGSPFQAKDRPEDATNGVIQITFWQKKLLPTGRIRAQQSHHVGELIEAVERARDVRIIVFSDEVEVERVLPWLAFDRTRFDFREVDFEDRERAESTEKRARLVRDAEDDRCFPAPR